MYLDKLLWEAHLAIIEEMTGEQSSKGACKGMLKHNVLTRKPDPLTVLVPFHGNTTHAALYLIIVISCSMCELTAADPCRSTTRVRTGTMVPLL